MMSSIRSVTALPVVPSVSKWLQPEGQGAACFANCQKGPTH